jgi:hypothetical protein
LIKQVSLLALAALSLGRLGIAGPCSNGTLSSYVSLGAAGCTIGNNTLYDFNVFLSGTAGASELAPSAVNLTPSGGNYLPTLAVSVTQAATDGNTIETFFTYDISGAGYIATAASLSGSSETPPDGAVTGIENYCEGGSFGPDGVDGCPGANGALVTADGFQNTDGAAFSKIPFIAVTDDFTIDGPASAGTFTNSFAAVPEPISISLTAVGLILAGLWGAARRCGPITKQN